MIHPVPKPKKRSKRRGRSRFPKRREPGLVAWIRTMRCLMTFHSQGCDVYLNRQPTEPAHIKTQGSGGYDRDNVVPLCPKHHDEQEGNTLGFEEKYGLDLRKIAEGYTREYDEAVKRGWGKP